MSKFIEQVNDQDGEEYGDWIQIEDGDWGYLYNIEIVNDQNQKKNRKM